MTIRGRATGSLVADRMGDTTTYALHNLQERGTLFVRPGTKVYEGMIMDIVPRADATPEKLGLLMAGVDPETM